MDTMHWESDIILTKLSVTAFATMLVVLFVNPCVTVTISSKFILRS